MSTPLGMVESPYFAATPHRVAPFGPEAVGGQLGGCKDNMGWNEGRD